MSPVLRLGRSCSNCNTLRPLWRDGVCAPCWYLLRAFGRVPDVEQPTLDEEIQAWLETL